jgi:hypothetical protein
MSYEKTNWVDRTPTNSGTPINATNLNKIEQGIKDATDAKKSLKYTIAAPNAIEPFKSRADLILNTTSPHTQLANAVTTLHNARGGNTDVPIVIEFCPGLVELPSGANWVIPETKGNIYIYGNGVKFNGSIENENLFSIVDCWLFDLEVKNRNFGHGINAYNSTLTNCSGSSSDFGHGINAYNSTLTNCSGSGSGGYYGDGIYANGSCIIQGCDGTQGGISVPSTGTYPQTLGLLQELNKGTITIRS